MNYKDALAGTGKGKILRRFPLVGGIDVAGYVVQSSDPAFREGDEVLVTGCGLSETRDGGYAQYARLESKWVVPRPAGLSLRETMLLGTAGFTAGLALHRMLDNRQVPAMGPLCVTGATGGVGSLAVAIFTRAGFEVHAVSGKADQHAYLQALGATQVHGREALATTRPMESAIFGGGLDNVGGPMLASLLAQTAPYGNVATAGLAATPELQATVMPFIIRGVSLLGVASAGTARDIRDAVWARLASDWKPATLDRIDQGRGFPSQRHDELIEPLEPPHFQQLRTRHVEDEGGDADADELCEQDREDGAGPVFMREQPQADQLERKQRDDGDGEDDQRHRRR